MGKNSSSSSRRRPLLISFVLLLLIAAGVAYWLRPASRPNILLVTFDTTRADRMGAYGYSDGLTTAFDKLAERGVVFERAYAPCPITLPSHATMLTGLYPPEHDLRVNGVGRLSSEIPFLPEILKQQGYDTAAFIAAAPVLGAQFGLNRGFDNYDDEPAGSSFRTRPFGGERRDGEEVVNLALDWLQQRTDNPFFCWIHLYDAHGPYDPYEDVYGDRFKEEPYNAGVAWEVQQFDRVNTWLAEQQLDDNTLIVIVGDHGEGLEDHGEHEHGMMVYDTTLHVPLVFAGLDACRPGTRVDSVVSLVDLMPTLLELLQLPLPENMSGSSLLPALQGQTIESHDCYAEAELPYFLNRWCPPRAVISDRWKYIQSTRPELYDLHSDPGELTNLVETAADEVPWLEELLASMQDSFTQTSAETVQLSAKELADLQSLGYVASGGPDHGDSDDVNIEELIDIKDMVEFVSKYEEAKHYAAGGGYEQAIALLQEVADATTDFPMADLRLGDLMAQTGKLEKAQEIYRSVLKRRPDYVTTHRSMAKTLASQQQFEPAADHIREYIKVNPDDPTGHMELAQILVAMKQADEAIAAYREALRISPDLASAKLSLGSLLAMLRRPAEAVPLLEEVLASEPRHFPAMQNLMMVYAQTGQVPRAIQTGMQAIRLNPGSFETRFNLGLMLIQNRQFTEGIQQLREAQKLRPDDPRPGQQIQQAEAAMRAAGR